jgi:ribosomal protein L11 methyltransferase
MPRCLWPRSGARRFYRTRLTLPAEREEAAVGALWEAGCLGVQVVAAARSTGDRRLTLLAFFPGGVPRAAASRRIRTAFGASGLGDLRPGALRPMAGRRWVEAWQRSLRPMLIGRRVLVVPEGCRAPRAAGRVAIRVRFGQAFGTGEHATTRLCLRLLERHLVAGDRTVDLGCGTGILAMAAARLGASSVVAVDDDPMALGVARANLADNRLRRRVGLRHADAADALRDGPFDLALVNIGATVIARLLPDLARRLGPGGRAILAGFLLDDEARLLGIARAAGLAIVERRRARPWSALVLRRPAGDAPSSIP